MGPLQIDLFASQLTKQLPTFYSWRADPEAQGTDAFDQDWSQMRGFAKPPWCLIAHCLESSKETSSQCGDNHPSMAITTMVPINPGMLKGSPRLLPVRDTLVMLQTEQDFIMNQNVSVLVA